MLNSQVSNPHIKIEKSTSFPAGLWEDTSSLNTTESQLAIEDHRTRQCVRVCGERGDDDDDGDGWRKSGRHGGYGAVVNSLRHHHLSLQYSPPHGHHTDNHEQYLELERILQHPAQAVASIINLPTYPPTQCPYDPNESSSCAGLGNCPSQVPKLSDSIHSRVKSVGRSNLILSKS